MYIKTTADIVNEVNWYGLNFSERFVLKTMIDMSFENRLIQRSELNWIMKEHSITSITKSLIILREEGFIERHCINGIWYYEANPFTERVPCV